MLVNPEVRLQGEKEEEEEEREEEEALRRESDAETQEGWQLCVPVLDLRVRYRRARAPVAVCWRICC